MPDVHLGAVYLSLHLSFAMFSANLTMLWGHKKKAAAPNAWVSVISIFAAIEPKISGDGARAYPSKSF